MADLNGLSPAATLPRGVMAWPAFETDSPYNHLLYRPMVEQGIRVDDWSPKRLLRAPPSVLHLHWPEVAIQVPSASKAAARGFALLALVAAARARGSRIVWTVHNLHPHEQLHPTLQKAFWRSLVRLLDGYIALSQGGADAAMAEFPPLRKRQQFVIPIGHYRGAYADTVSRDEARSRLGLAAAAPVFGFIGKIRAYKNVPHLITMFRSLPDLAARLVIAGRPDGAPTRAAIIEAAGGDPRVVLVLEHIPDESVQLYLRAYDVLVLPFTEILNSSSAILGLSFDLPVLVPRAGAMGELQQIVGPEWLRAYDGALTAEGLHGALEWARSSRRGICRGLEHQSWERVARLTMEAYTALAHGRAA